MDFAEFIESEEMTALYRSQIAKWNGFNDPKIAELLEEAMTYTVAAFALPRRGDVTIQDMRLDPEFDKKYIELRDRLLKIDNNPGKSKRLKEEGIELFKKGQYEEAAKKYTTAMRFALDPCIYCIRSAAFHCMKDYDKALRDCRATLVLDPSHAEPFIRIGLIFTSLGYHEETVRAYKKAVEMEPGEQRYKDSLKEAEEMLKRQNRTAIETAEEQARLATSQMSLDDPNIPDALRRLNFHNTRDIEAYLQLIQKNREELLKKYGMMMNDPEYRHELMRFYLTGDVAAAQELQNNFLQHLIKTDPEKAMNFERIISDFR